MSSNTILFVNIVRVLCRLKISTAHVKEKSTASNVLIDVIMEKRTWKLGVVLLFLCTVCLLFINAPRSKLAIVCYF